MTTTRVAGTIAASVARAMRVLRDFGLGVRPPTGYGRARLPRREP
jgi:hypothetical protein